MTDKSEQDRRRDDALRRALGMRPIHHHERQESATVRLTADSSALLALIDSADRALEVVHSGVDLPKFPKELVSVEMDAAVAPGAGEVGVRFQPSEGFRGFVAALRAGDVDFGAVE
jgi:hypothetical protein